MTEVTHEYAYVYTCYDPAIRDEIIAYCEKRFGPKNYFFDSDPGAVFNLTRPKQPSFFEFVIWKMKLAANVHPYSIILIINHSMCGAYADAGITFADPEEESAYHASEMDTGIKFLRSEFPDMKIESHYFLKKEQRLAY